MDVECARFTYYVPSSKEFGECVALGTGRADGPLRVGEDDDIKDGGAHSYLHGTKNKCQSMASNTFFDALPPAESDALMHPAIAMGLKFGNAGRLLQLHTCPIAASSSVCGNFVGSVHNDGIAVRGASMSALENFQCTYVEDSAVSSPFDNDENDANNGVATSKPSSQGGILHSLYAEFASGKATTASAADGYALTHQSLEGGVDAWAGRSRCVGQVRMFCADIRIPLRDAIVYHDLSQHLFVDSTSSSSSSSTHALAMHSDGEYHFHTQAALSGTGSDPGNYGGVNFTPESFGLSDLKKSRGFMIGFCRRFGSTAGGSKVPESAQSLFRKQFMATEDDGPPTLCSAPSLSNYRAGVVQIQRPVEVREFGLAKIEMEIFGGSKTEDEKRYRFVDAAGNPIMVGCA